MTDSENLQAKAAGIAKETADSLKNFSKETAMLLYAKQMADNNNKANFPEETGHKKLTKKEADLKLNKMMEEAKLKWKYADHNARKKVAQMEQIVLVGQEKIKNLYNY